MKSFLIANLDRIIGILIIVICLVLFAGEPDIYDTFIR